MAFEKIALILLGLAVGLCYGFNMQMPASQEDDEGDWPNEFTPLETLSFWDDDEPIPAGPNACCFPKAWQGTVFSKIVSGGRRSEDLNEFDDDEEEDKPKPKPRPRPGPRVIKSMVKAYVDENNKRVAEDVTVAPKRGKNATQISYIVLFNTTGNSSSATLYAFSKTAQKCFKKVVKNAKFQPQCLPANSTLLGSFSLGAGARALKAQSWGFRARTERLAVAGALVVTPGNCVPVMGQEKVCIHQRFSLDDDKPKPKPKPKSMEFKLGTLYVDIQTSISDPSVFTPPSYCNATSNALFYEPDMDFTEIMYRYVSLD